MNPLVCLTWSTIMSEKLTTLAAMSSDILTTTDDTNDDATWRLHYKTYLEREEATEDEVKEGTNSFEAVRISALHQSLHYDPVRYGQVKLGQIRLAPNSWVDYNCHKVTPAVFCVIQKWTNNLWLTVPFSPLEIPTHSGEMTSGIYDVSCLRVLEVWNAKIVPAAMLEPTEVLTYVVPEDFALDARDLFRHLATGIPLLQTFKAKRGPTVNLWDAVFSFKGEYQNEERDKWKPLNQLVVNDIS